MMMGEQCPFTGFPESMLGVGRSTIHYFCSSHFFNLPQVDSSKTVSTQTSSAMYKVQQYLYPQLVLIIDLKLHSLMPKGAGSRPTWRPFRDLQHKHKKCVLQFVFLILWKMQLFLAWLNIYIFSFLLLLFPLLSFVGVVAPLWAEQGPCEPS